MDATNPDHRSGRPSVEVMDLGFAWDGGAPIPRLLAASNRAVVLCYEATPYGHDDTIVQLDFDGCESVRMGGPNEEALHGHPLFENGPFSYDAYVVHRSPWLAEERRVNSVHEWHDDARWNRLHHYFLVFHDEVVEALATNLAASRLDGDMATELARVASEMSRHA